MNKLSSVLFIVLIGIVSSISHAKKISFSYPQTPTLESASFRISSGNPAKIIFVNPCSSCPKSLGITADTGLQIGDTHGKALSSLRRSTRYNSIFIAYDADKKEALYISIAEGDL